MSSLEVSLNSVLSSLYIGKGVVEEWNYVLLNYKEVSVICHKEEKSSVAVIFYKQLQKFKLRYLFQTFAVHYDYWELFMKSMVLL